MHAIKLLCICFVYWTTVNGVDDIYFITIPKLLITETPHKFNIHTSTNLKIIIETVHKETKFKHRNPVHIIRKGYTSIPYYVPFVSKGVGSTLQINIRGDICNNLPNCNSRDDVVGKFINETYELELIDKNFIILAETDKPIYKPGEKIQLRFMPIYSTNLMRKPEQIGKQWKIFINSAGAYQRDEIHERNEFSKFDLIVIENSDGGRVAQWTNIGLEDAMNLNYQLSNDPVLGQWKSWALFEGQKETIKFTIEKYVLPRFIVDIMPPKGILLSDKFVNFKVCAKYSTGKKMAANIQGSICISSTKQMCRMFTKTLKKQSCAKVSVESKHLFDQEIKRWWYRSSKTTINVTVIETGTTSKVSKSVSGDGIFLTPYKIKFEGKPYFKPGLPYFGQIRLNRHSGKPQKNTNITVSVTGRDFPSSWGFHQIYTSDKNGLIEFVIPYIPVEKSVSMSMAGIRDKSETQMNDVIVYQSLSNWESVDNQYLQIQPISKSLNCPGDLHLTILTNYDVSTIEMYVQIISRGLIKEIIEYLPVPDKCTSRDDHIGHYTCLGGYNIKCLSGWKGDNCREPICEEGCVNGACVNPNKCVCRDGWQDKNCNKCIVAPFCKNGYCKYGNDCECYPGWRKYDCSERGPKKHFYEEITKTPPKTTTETVKNEKERQTIFERIISVPMTKNMGPDAHIVVYFINANKEVIADAVEISDGLQNCSHLGGGKFQFNKKTSLPQTQVKLLINPGTKNASCAVKITDEALLQFGSASNVDLSYLVKKLIQLNHKIATDSQRNPRRGSSCISDTASKMSLWIGYNVGYDSKRTFSQSGFDVITNTRIVNTKCQFMMMERHLPMNTMFKTFAKSSSVQKKEIVKQIREYFPESWLFSYYNKTVNQIDLTVPDSMTTWRANAFCMTEKGIWISPSKRLKVILPFFADIYVPYSIKLDELLSLPVKLFNYLDACYEINVQIHVNPKEIQIIGLKSFTLCVCANEEKTVYFKIKPQIIGRLNITVEAASKYSSFCSDKIQKITDIAMTDAIRRQLFVEPPGIPTETTFSELICNKNEQFGIVELFHLPKKIVTGSLRSYLKFNGDAMGQTFDNLDKLVTMPYGCGEQNMVAVVPSIYVLKYLNGLKIDNPQLHQRARTYIIEGYNRQMKYKHDDGSYSAFGKTDKAGSTWLTAFVLRSFSEASKYVKLEKNILTEAIKYLGKMQSKSGCFKENGKLFSSTMAGGVKKSDNTDESLLTAYVLLSVMDISSKRNFLDIDKGLSCVQNGLSSKSSNYQLALIAYVFSVYQANSKLSNSLMKQLIERVEISGRYQYWPFDRDANENSKINSADIETTGYAFLALHNYQPMSESLKTIYWLSNQRNSLGGYYSTQDTVVALNALAVFAESIGMSKLVHLNVSVVLNEIKTYTDLITEENRLVSRSISLGAENISYISIKTNGSGCLSIQLISLYNIDKSYTAADTFKISVKAKVPSKNECKIRKIRVCFAYLRRDKDSNMILVTINYPSGWQLPKDDVKELTDQIATPLKRIDFHNTKMELYYDAFSYNDAGKEVCFKFQLEEKSKVSNLKPAFVRIMDYYSPEIYSDASYDILQETCNKTNETTIPDKPKVLLCPTCVEHSKDSTFKFLKRICQSWLSGLVIANNSGAKNRVFYQAQYSIFYEWTLDMEPTNCTCLKTWPHLNTNFVILSTYWKHLGEKLVLSNDSVMFPLDTLLAAYRFDLSNQCWQANNLYQMMSRLNSSFVSQLKQIGSCAKCVLGSNFNFNIANITSWICANYTSWNFEITQISHRIEGVLSNNSSTRIFVDAEFPDELCYCRHQMKDLKRSFRILDLKNSIKSINNDRKSPLRLLLDNRFEIVEDSVFTYNKHIKCHK